MNVTVSEVIVAVFILIGTFFSFLSAIGLIRLPDVYTRSHAASKSTTLGVLCTLFGTFLYFLVSDSYISIRLILGIFFVFLTAPVSAHMICSFRLSFKCKISRDSVQDDLKEYIRQNTAAESNAD